MEDLKQIQEFFSKPLNENVFVEAFKLQKALEGMGYDVKVKAVDDFGTNVFEIYFNNPADADDSIYYDVEKLGYDNVRVFANPQESLDEAYIVTYAKSKGEKPASAAYKHRGSALAFMRDLEKDGYITMLTQKPVDGVDESVNEDKKLTLNNFVQMVRDDMMAGSSPDDYVSDERVRKDAKYLYNRYLQGASIDDLFEYNTGIYYDPAKERNAIKAKEASKTAMDRIKDMIKKIASEQMGEALADYEEKEANYDELYGDYKYKVDEAKPKKGHGEKVSKDFFAKLKGKTVNYKGADYKVIDSDEAVIKLKHEDGDTKTINLKQFNDSGLIDEIIETVLLGRQLNEKLCKKGEAYRKKRIAAGEKSSAYLNGRAVKVCKGQMKG
jgi:hypothetical protein